MSLWQDKVRLSTDGASRDVCNRKLLESYRLLYGQTKDPSLLYRMGGVSLALRQGDDARSYFQRTIEAAPVTSDLRVMASNQIARLVRR